MQRESEGHRENQLSKSGVSVKVAHSINIDVIIYLHTKLDS